MSDDRADEIARELWRGMPYGEMTPVETIAAALRAYGCAEADAKLEEVCTEIDWRASLLPVRSAKRSGLLSLIPFIDSLRSKPEAQDTP
jgi:hypothetical protein